jgi:succinate dehydrogenase hydrophobic anchor subunit
VEESQQQKQQKTDELVQLVAGVLLMAFAVIAIAVMLAMQVSSVLNR